MRSIGVDDELQVVEHGDPRCEDGSQAILRWWRRCGGRRGVLGFNLEPTAPAWGLNAGCRPGEGMGWAIADCWPGGLWPCMVQVHGFEEP
ncbi:hypothetical protein ACFX15_043698 [Malus domestica]